jgi:hypothetical protein
VVGLEVGGDLGLGLVAVLEKLLLVVQELLAGLGSVLVVLGCGLAWWSGEGDTCVLGHSLSTMASTGHASWQKPQ